MTYKFCDEVYHPFNEMTINEFPKSEAYIDASKNDIITSYRWIPPTIYGLKYILNALKPIVFGIVVYSNFEELNKENYILNPPSETDQYLGMHALILCGYKQDTFIVCNSYGHEFGKDGFFEISNAYILDPKLSFDFFMIYNT